jgi:hypothetical protein
MATATPDTACPICAAPMVRRTRRADETPFLGCSRYPACRGTRQVEVAPSAPPPPPVAAVPVISLPGASARSEFVRRETAHAELVQERRPWILARGVALSAVGVVLVLLGGTWGLLGAVTIVLALLMTIVALYVPPDSVIAWRTGATGEELTASALATLPAGFVSLHDRRKPRSKANIDHLVIGPTGVWVVETKNYKGSLSVRDGDLWIAGRRKTAFIAQVKGQAAAVSGVLGGVPVLPIICIHRAEFPLLGRPELFDVRIVGPKGLIDAITKAPAVLGPGEVAGLARTADELLVPAAR